MKGVDIRRILHEQSQTNSKQIESWKEIGAQVRYLPDYKMLIIDRRIVYITSYDSKNNSSGFGVRFGYEPLALQMSSVFEQNWQKAKQL